jgi:hypothetical protein
VGRAIYRKARKRGIEEGRCEEEYIDLCLYGGIQLHIHILADLTVSEEAGKVEGKLVGPYRRRQNVSRKEQGSLPSGKGRSWRSAQDARCLLYSNKSRSDTTWWNILSTVKASKIHTSRRPPYSRTIPNGACYLLSCLAARPLSWAIIAMLTLLFIS